MRVYELHNQPYEQRDLGLFAARDFKKGDHIADYTGDQIILQDDQIGGPYVLAINTKRSV